MRDNAMIMAAVAVLLVTGLGLAHGGGSAQQVAGASAVQGPEGPRGPRGGGLEMLDLTQEQRQQVRQLMQAEREASEGTIGRMRDLQHRLQQAIFAGEGDAAAIGEQIGALQAELLQARIAHLQKLAAILTAEQRARMAAMPVPGPGPMGPGGPGGPGGPWE